MMDGWTHNFSMQNMKMLVSGFLKGAVSDILIFFLLNLNLNEH